MPKIFALRNSLLEVQQSIGLELDDSGLHAKGGGQQTKDVSGHRDRAAPSPLLLGCFQEEEEIRVQQSEDDVVVRGLDDSARPTAELAEAAAEVDEADEEVLKEAEGGEREGSDCGAGKREGKNSKHVWMLLLLSCLKLAWCMVQGS